MACKKDPNCLETKFKACEIQFSPDSIDYFKCKATENNHGIIDSDKYKIEYC